MKVSFCRPLMNIAGLSFSTACQSPRALTTSDLDSAAGEVRLRTIELIDGRIIDCRSTPNGYAVLRDSIAILTMPGGEERRIPIDSIRPEGSTRFSAGGDVGILLLVVAVIGVVVLLVSQPFVFTH